MGADGGAGARLPAIALSAIGFNLLGDGLRDALNPRDER
jgi:ABC-type dipeptide/oligopeptide/nickel transport system permease subunit